MVKIIQCAAANRSRLKDQYAKQHIFSKSQNIDLTDGKVLFYFIFKIKNANEPPFCSKKLLTHQIVPVWLERQKALVCILTLLKRMDMK